MGFLGVLLLRVLVQYMFQGPGEEKWFPGNPVGFLSKWLVFEGFQEVKQADEAQQAKASQRKPRKPKQARATYWGGTVGSETFPNE